MASLDTLIQAWDAAHWELSEAFQGLPDEDVWLRADPRLLSIGEIVGHMAYWEIENYTVEGAESPFHSPGFRYFTDSVASPVELSLTAAETYSELQRVHGLAKARLRELAQDSEVENPARPGWTYGATLEYTVFHTAYHTGQIYSVRHLLGHQTVDN